MDELYRDVIRHLKEEVWLWRIIAFVLAAAVIIALFLRPLLSPFPCTTGRGFYFIIFYRDRGGWGCLSGTMQTRRGKM